MVTGTWLVPPTWSMTSLMARVKGGCLLLGSGVVGWLVTWLTDKNKLIVYQPVLHLIASGIRVAVVPCGRMNVELSHCQVFLRLEINAVEV